MMLALLLAQLVLPWPGLDSPLVQPGPTICVGECAGPVVWGPAERGRLVVACDMRSDTCSYGRRITTVRASPVPCETSPGVWEMVPEDTGCYSVRGLESWAATTSYLAYGADLTNTAWIKQTGMSVEKVGSVYRIRRNRDDTGAAFVHQEIAAVAQQETWTAACVMRAGTATVARLSVHRSSAAAVVNLTSEWQVFANTKTLEEGQVPGVSIGPAFTAGDSYIEVAGCWLTKSDTPGRPCWGGEAPVTCAADRHTISTEGWPTTHGSIEVEFRIDEAPQNFAIILDGRSSTPVGFNIHYDTGTGRLNHRQDARIMAGPTIELGTWYRVRLEREGGDARMYVNGVLVASESDWPVWSYPYQSGVAVLGKHSSQTASYVNGPISSLRIRSFE